MIRSSLLARCRVALTCPTGFLACDFKNETASFLYANNLHVDTHHSLFDLAPVGTRLVLQAVEAVTYFVKMALSV